MKNNYGFTLIELLAIVVILGVIIAVAAPNMTKQINKKEETDQTILDEKISNAAHMYIAKYYSDKVVGGTCDSSTCSFALNDLEQDGLINLKNKNCTEVMNAKIFYNSSDNSYNFDTIRADKVSNALDCASDGIKK